jgi:alkylation response protein AidB-like acyl-CoA dehydrogenase
VPRELGGEGLEVEQLCEILRSFAHACPSTALAFSMHTHQVAVNAWRWRHQKAPVAPLLEKVAREGVVLMTTGGADWLQSSGEAIRAEGGYRVSARKAFASGAPAGDLLLTSAIVRDGRTPAQIIHFAIPASSAGFSIVPTWRALGMRNTGSHEVVLDDVFVPEAAVTLCRVHGEWHVFFHLLCMLALPIIYSVYLGIAEAARERALELARRRRPDEHLLQAVGDMENQLAAARIAHADWVTLAKSGEPGMEGTNRAMIDRVLVTKGVLGTADAAMNVVGGAAFLRANGLERLFRDVQGARYHPLQEGPQRALAGRCALGREVSA